MVYAPTMVTVQLTEEEMILAYTTGIKRQFAHRDPITGKRFSTHRFTAYDSDFTGDIKGCLVECAVSKYYGTKWNNDTWNLKNHLDNKDYPDVEPHFEVRRARSTKGELTVRTTDAEHKVAILGCVDEQSENFVYLLGAISVKEVLNVFKADARGNLYVPQESLYHPDKFTLIEV